MDEIKPGGGKIISLVPLTAKGIAKYLKYENLRQETGVSPSFNIIFKHDTAEILHLGKTINLGGYIAYHQVSLALRKWSGEIVMINGMASLNDGIFEI